MEDVRYIKEQPTCTNANKTNHLLAGAATGRGVTTGPHSGASTLLGGLVRKYLNLVKVSAKGWFIDTSRGVVGRELVADIGNAGDYRSVLTCHFSFIYSPTQCDIDRLPLQARNGMCLIDKL